MIGLVPRRLSCWLAIRFADWARGLTCTKIGPKHAWVIEFTIAYLRNGRLTAFCPCLRRGQRHNPNGLRYIGIRCITPHNTLEIRLIKEW
jgi:hypothetical protein